MGPGTRIITRLNNNIQPINRQDAASMIHDIEYLNPHIPEKVADQTALANAGSYFNPLKIAMKAGFTLKDILGGYNAPQDINKYRIAKQLLYEKYPDVISKYNLQLTKYNKHF